MSVWWVKIMLNPSVHFRYSYKIMKPMSNILKSRALSDHWHSFLRPFVHKLAKIRLTLTLNWARPPISAIFSKLMSKQSTKNALYENVFNKNKLSPEVRKLKSRNLFHVPKFIFQSTFKRNRSKLKCAER